MITKTYYISLPRLNIDCLGAIRNWNDPKLAFDKDIIWIKDLNKIQIESVEIQSIPGITIFYEKDNKLFKRNSLLPYSNIPYSNIPSLLWTPLTRALPIELPQYNDNFFTISSKLKLQLIPSETEKEGYALITSLHNLGNYIETAPDVRLKPLQWTIINNNALIAGTPMLPIKGEVYWLFESLLIPVGYGFNYPVLLNEFCKKLPADSFVICTKDEGYKFFDKASLSQLSISSFRRSTINI